MRGQPGHLEFSVRSGAIQIAWNDEGLLTRVHIHPARTPGDATEDSPWIPKRALRLIENMVDYFDRGTPLDQISWEDLAVSQWTDFQKKVYQATSLIPHGETRTYGWVAQKIGHNICVQHQPLRRQSLTSRNGVKPSSISGNSSGIGSNESRTDRSVGLSRGSRTSAPPSRRSIASVPGNSKSTGMRTA